MRKIKKHSGDRMFLNVSNISSIYSATEYIADVRKNLVEELSKV